MKHHSTILVLAFLLLAFPVSFKSQTHKSRVKTQKVRQNSDEVQAKEIVTQLIDGIFIKRNTLSVFQNLFSYAYCDSIDKDILDQNCSAKNLYPDDLERTKLGRNLRLKIIASGWRQMCEEFYFILGTKPINKETNEAYPYSSSDYDLLASEILKKNSSLVPEYDFTKLNKKVIEQRLSEIEDNLNEIENLVFKRIDKTIYDRNIKIMKETVTIKTIVKKGRKYYGADVKGLIFSFILTKRNGQLKIVGMEDDI